MNSEIIHSDFRIRLAQLIGEEEPFKWAKRLGISAATFDRMWNGGTMPKVETLQRVVSATGVSLDWLVRGVGEGGPSTQRNAGPALDDELLGRITDAVARLYREERVGLSHIDLGRISARKYNEITTATEDQMEQIAMIKLVVTQLRSELRATAAEPGTGKRLA